MNNIATIRWLQDQPSRRGREQIGRYRAPIVLLALLAFSLFVPLIFALQPCVVSAPFPPSASAEYQQPGSTHYTAIADIIDNNQLIPATQSSTNNTCPIIVRQSNSPPAALVQASYQVVLCTALLLLLV